MNTIIKPGPKPKYDFTAYPIGYEIELLPLKQSSFKSTLSAFNKGRDPKQQWGYEQAKKFIIATRLK